MTKTIEMEVLDAQLDVHQVVQPILDIVDVQEIADALVVVVAAAAEINS